MPLRAPRPTRQPPSIRQIALPALILSLILLIPAIVSMLPGAPAPKGLRESVVYRYFSLAGGVFLLGASVYLLMPGVAERYNRKIALAMAKPAENARKFRNAALVVTAVVVAEVPIAALAWPSDEGRTWAVVAIGTTLLMLIAMIGAQIQWSKRKVS